MGRDLSALLGTPDEEQAQTSTGNDAAPIPAVIHEQDLAALLGISRTRLSNLARDGVLPKLGKPYRSHYGTRAAIGAYCERLRAHAQQAGRPVAQSNEELREQKIRVARAQAEALEQKNAIAAGELVRADEVRREWTRVLADLRSGLLSVTSRVGASLPHLTAHDLSCLDSEIRSALQGLADDNHD